MEKGKKVRETNILTNIFQHFATSLINKCYFPRRVCSKKDFSFDFERLHGFDKISRTL